MAVKKIELPALKDYLPHLDLDAVAEAILTPDRLGDPEPNFSNQDFEVIKEMVWSAAERWLPRDLHEIDIDGIEQEHGYPGLNFKSTLDLEGTLRGLLPPFEPFKGERVILDWKTHSGDFDGSDGTNWKNYKLDSWQWRIYAAIRGARVFNYRGISKRCSGGTCPTKDLILVVPPTNEQEVAEYLGANFAKVKALAAFEVWPRDWSSCYRYGRECPFKSDCDEYLMPRFSPSLDATTLTRSWMETFDLCNERGRRISRNRNAEGTDETSIGQSFHRGIAAVYEQALQIKL